MNEEIISHGNFFYTPLKIASNEKVFFTSDLHFDHDRDFIWGKRGYKDVTEMNETQVKNWNSVITNNDIVFHMGDFKFNRNVTYENILRILNFKTIFLMPGNHMSGFGDVADKMIGHCGYLLDGYKRVQPIPNYFELWHRKQFIVLCHYPIGSWNKIRNGAFQFFGHCHSMYNPYTIGKQIDVGFDNFPVPQSFDDLQRIVGNKKSEFPEKESEFFE